MKQSVPIVALGALLVAACADEERGEAAETPPAGYAPVQAGKADPASLPSLLPPGVVQVSQVQIPDPSGFARPMIAATAFIPSGWRAEGGVVWGPHGECGDDFGMRWTIVSPDGASRLSMIPMQKWSGLRSAYPAGQPNRCGEAFHTSARAFLEDSASRMFPGARLLDYRPLHKEAKPYQDVLSQFPPVNEQTMQSSLYADAGELLIGYQENGREMRAVLSTVVFITQARFSDLMNPGQVVMESVTGAPFAFTVVAAPDGQLDFGLRKRVMSSMRNTPEWSREIAAYQARRHKQHADASRAAHQARMDAIRKTGEIISGAYEDRQLVNDRLHRENIEAIRGVETYLDPVSGDPVQLDSNYSHAWRVNGADNTYLMTNDPNFDPGLHRIDARRLEVMP